MLPGCALTVIIPTFLRRHRAAACVASLVGQRSPAPFEILVGSDGPDPDLAPVIAGVIQPASAAPTRGDSSMGGHAHVTFARQADDRPAVRVFEFSKSSAGGVRNHLLAHARGQVVLFLNDDVTAHPDLIATHLAAQHAEPALIVGSAPWRLHPDDSIFDRLVRETSMVFFYDVMDAAVRADPAAADRRDWGFRHCYSLNLSAPRAALERVGGFTVVPGAYGHEDIELAHRVQTTLGLPLRYRPAAQVIHDHRYGPADILRREVQLGKDSWAFARLRPAFAQAVFGRDITAPAELAYSREFVAREHAAAERQRATFTALAELPAGSVPASDTSSGTTMIRALYEQHLLLKRYEWRRGLLAAAEGEPAQAAA